MDDRKESLNGARAHEETEQEDSGVSAVQRQLAEYRKRMSTKVTTPSSQPVAASVEELDKSDPKQRLLMDEAPQPWQSQSKLIRNNPRA